MRALVRPPSPRLAEGLLTHQERVSVDAELALRQWHDYTDALSAHGWELECLPALDDAPDGVFVEDTMVVRGDLAVITRPAHPSRQIEIDSAREGVSRLGYRLAEITHPGYLEGGDVLSVPGGPTYAGLTTRTNREGIAQLSELLATEVIAVPCEKVLHLKTAVTALPDGTVIGYPDLVDDASVFERIMAVPEPSGAHVVRLGEGRLLMAASAPKSAALFADLGFEPVLVDISEFEKLEGCVTCLSVRLRPVG